MTLEELRVPLPDISIEAKRELPDFVIEEKRAEKRLEDPSIKRPVRPMYSFVRTRTPNLETQPTTDGMLLWEQLREAHLKQANHPRWVGSVAVGNRNHTVVWFSVLQSSGHESHYQALRCDCNLPDFDEPDTVEYRACEATDKVIETRAVDYKNALGLPEHLEEMNAIPDVLRHLVSEVKGDSLIWPPSHRSDVLLVDGLAMTFGVSSKKILDAAQILEEDKIIKINETERPSLTLAA